MPHARLGSIRLSRWFGSIFPLSRHEISGDVLAGVTLAALGIPEVLGYAKIAGMPVVTGLYTILLPIAVFALLGSSRHLVVGADSATAAIFAAGAVSLAPAGSPRYVALAGLAALITAALLLAARLVRLGFLANFLSRTALIGFLTGVGIQVACGQLATMLGVRESGRGTISRLIDAVRGIPHTQVPTLIVALAVIAVILVTRRITKRVPGALLAVVGVIIVSRFADLPAHGVAVLGHVPTGLPHAQLSDLRLSDVTALLSTCLSLFVVILAQSAATSRAYAARYNETFNQDRDLVGLALANAAAGLSGTFVVNGSPTKTQMVTSAGGRSQLAQLTTAVAVLLVLLFLTGPLQFLPSAALAAIVFLIGIELIDLRGMRAIWRVRRIEFGIAALTGATVVVLGVEQGIVLAIALSLIDHLRYSYSPRNTVLTSAGNDRWKAKPVAPDERTFGALIIYRFADTLYYANAHSLRDDVTTFLHDQKPLDWFCMDGAAIDDIDYTAAQVLERIFHELAERKIRLVFVEMALAVRDELDRYGITALTGKDAFFEAPADVVAAYRRQQAAKQTKPAGNAKSPSRKVQSLPKAGDEPGTVPSEDEVLS